MQVGDLVFCSNKGLIGAAIRFAQRRNHEVDWERNHVCILDSFINGVWYVLQAEPGGGITNDKPLLTIAVGGTFEVLPLPVTIDREKFIEFQRSKLGIEYSFSSILSDAVSMFLPERLYFRWGKGLVCSGLVALALLYAGFEPMTEVEDLYSQTPAQVKRAILGEQNDGAKG
jgi:hypothetical protein